MADSVHEAIVDAAVAAITALNLETDAGTPLSVLARLTIAPLVQGGGDFPAVVVSPDGIERGAGGTNRRKDTGYPLTVRIVHRLPAEDADTLPQFLRWRAAIRGALEAAVLADGYDCVYLDSPVIEVGALEFDLLSSPLSFDVLAREAR